MKQIFSILFLLLAFSACTVEEGGGGGSGAASPTELTVTFEYDFLEPDLAGFRCYNYFDGKIIFDTADYPTYSNFEEYKPLNQPATISFTISLSGITSTKIQRGSIIGLTAYTKTPDNIEIESTYSAPITIK